MTVIQPAQHLGLREKLIRDGARNLSDTELLAIFISSGSSKKTCLQLAFDLIQQVGDLRAVLNAAPQTFKQVSGLGDVRYVQLQAIKEICRRSDFIGLQKDRPITNSRQTFSYLKKRMRDYKNEVFSVLYLDNQHRIIAYEELFQGTVNSATVHLRPLIERILHVNAAAIILAHNHPSGVSDASSQDLILTERIRDALELMDVRLLDHIIVGDNEVYSIIAESKSVCN